MLLLNKSGGASCIGANGLRSPFPCSLATQWMILMLSGSNHNRTGVLCALASQCRICFVIMSDYKLGTQSWKVAWKDLETVISRNGFSIVCLDMCTCLGKRKFDLKRLKKTRKSDTNLLNSKRSNHPPLFRRHGDPAYQFCSQGREVVQSKTNREARGGRKNCSL